MKQHITPQAKLIIEIIGEEYSMAKSRVVNGYIPADKLLPTLYERLNRRACQDVHLRKMLDDVGFIPDEDDEAEDRPWALDPREPRDLEVAGERPAANVVSSKARWGRSNALTG